MRRRTRPTPAARAGFTLVELMVAAGLTILIVTILAVAFQAALGTLSQLKSVAGLAEQGRTAQTVIQSDLKAQHLEDPNGSPVRVSDAKVAGVSWASPNRGYFVVRQPSQPKQSPSGPSAAPPYFPVQATDPNPYPYLFEGNDSEGVESFRAIDHSLLFTVKLDGTGPQNVFSCDAPFPGLAGNPTYSLVDMDPSGRQLVSRWAEVAYFLRPTALITSDQGGTLTPLRMYTLYRRVRVIPERGPQFTMPSPAGPIASPPYPAWPQDKNYNRELYPELSIATDTNTPSAGYNPANQEDKVNTPDTITNPLNRVDTVVDWRNYSGGPVKPITGALFPDGFAETAGAPTIVNQNRYGADVLLNNVVSFQVRVLFDTPPARPVVGGGTPTAYQFHDLAANGGYPASFDTFTTPSGGVPKPRLKAIQIKLRVFDLKNNMTRQLTITQDL